MANLIERREYTPKRFYAGEFPVVTETGTAGEAIALHDLVMSSETGIVKATKTGIANVVGIAVSEAAAKDDPIVYILTGEVFADAVGIGSTLTAAEAKAACRKLSIFLK